MELLLALATVYLILTLFCSADLFVVNAAAFVATSCVYIVSLLTANFWIFYLFAFFAIALRLPVIVSITFTDIVKTLSIFLVAIFWLNTTEFIDGYVFSKLFIALGIALVSHLLFLPQNRQSLCLLTILTAFGLIDIMSAQTDILATASALLIGYIFTKDLKSATRSNTAKKLKKS